MLGKCSCLVCKKVYSVKGIHTHVQRAHLGASHYSSGNNGKYKEISKKCREKKNKITLSYLTAPNKCKECEAVISYEKKRNSFCSRSCSANFSNRLRKESGWAPSKEQRIKTSESLTGKKYIEPVQVTSTCPCGDQFAWTKTVKINERLYCSRKCANKFSPANILRKLKARGKRSALVNYRHDCAFKFNLRDYPDEFDFSLIEKYGWYKAKNRGDNLTGVSRDHMFSVREGFDRNIDPKILCHPANCQLLPHSDNVTKHKTSSISLEDLVEKIEEWDKKYT